MVGLRMSMRFFRGFFAVAAFVVTPVAAQTTAPPVAADIERQNPDIDIYALMSGKCPTLKIADRDFACKTVGFFHGEKGRVSFTVVLDDPGDESHIISFSGMNGERTRNDLYDLPVDRIELTSKDRPKADGLPLPLIEPSSGKCRQIGSFVLQQVSNISCTATDQNGKKYELRFESDGSPIMIRRIRQTAPSISQDPFK